MKGRESECVREKGRECVLSRCVRGRVCILNKSVCVCMKERERERESETEKYYWL